MFAYTKLLLLLEGFLMLRVFSLLLIVAYSQTIGHFMLRFGCSQKVLLWSGQVAAWCGSRCEGGIGCLWQAAS